MTIAVRVIIGRLFCHWPYSIPLFNEKIGLWTQECDPDLASSKLFISNALDTNFRDVEWVTMMVAAYGIRRSFTEFI